MRTWIKLLASASVPSILSLAYPAQAQGAAQNDTVDIIVTANKREQNLSKVGATISALSAEALANQRVSNIADLAQATPGLAFAPSPTATPVYTLRGVGFFESSLAAYPDVSIYVDQIPLSFSAMTTLTAFDLERVEVLKGPQGTLFGNNATGGAINFIAAKPKGEYEARAEFSYGRFNTAEVSGYVTGPITDTLRARAAVKLAKGDEWQRSFTRDDKLGEQDNIAGRVLLNWDPTAGLHFELNLNAWRDQSDPQAPQKIANVPQNLPGSAGLGGVVPDDLPVIVTGNSPEKPRSADWSPTNRPYADNRFRQASLRSDIDVTPDVTVTSLTSYSKLTFLNATEGDGTAFEDQDIFRDAGTIESFTQELRISNGSRNRFRWVLGGNYEWSKVYESIDVGYRDSTAEALNGISISSYASTQHMKNYAGFASAELDISDAFTLKGGIRRTRAERRGENWLGDSPVYPATTDFTLTEFFNTVYGFIYGGLVAPIAPGGSIIIDNRTNADGTPVNPATYLKTGMPRNNLKENNTSWTVGVDYKGIDNLLLYANISRGYKAGSIPHLNGAIYSAFAPVKQEELTSYEGGFKAQLFGRKVTLNGAAFYYDYNDKQLRAKFVDPIFGALDTLVNVPKSTVKGAELDLTARPATGLAISAVATYLDAKVKRYDGIIGSVVDANGLRQPITADFSGVRLPFAPKVQYTLRADYEFAVSSELNGYLGAGVNGQSKSIGILTSIAGDRDLYKINARGIVNLSVGIGAEDEKWKLTLWGKNVFNKYHWSNTIQAYDFVVRYPGRPVEYGAALALKF